MNKLIAAIIIFAAAVSPAWAQSFRPRYGQNSSNKRSSTTKTQNRSLELRVLVDQTSPIGTNHKWLQALAEVGADRVVSETSRKTKPSFEEYGSGAIKTLAVVGIVKNGKLHLPGGKFSIGQTTAIRNHLQKLRDDGAEVTIAEKVAFGLTAPQLISVHDGLGKKIGSSTVGQKANSLANSILKSSGYPISMDRATKAALANDESIMQAELEGLSLGTALAITLRKMGLVFEPNRPQGKGIQLIVRAANEKTENWPVGWPISEQIKQAAPKYFVRVPIRAENTPILQVLGGIENRMDFPFIYDDARIAASDINLEATLVTYIKAKKSSYSMVVDKVLRQCKPKLKSDLRIDEVGKRFLWITTIR